MPRSPRIDLPGLPQHVIARGNDRKPCFFGDADRQTYLKYLCHAATVSDCELHAFVLMTNHVHLLVTGRSAGSISRMMQSVGRRYVHYVNRTHGRTGTLFEGRFKSSLVQTECYFLTCMRYIELNPVRAGMVAHPFAYPWSSFHENASGAPSGLLSGHPEYMRLGRDPSARGHTYVALVNEGVTAVDLSEIRANVQKSRVLGSDTFRRGLEATLKRCVTIVRPGRPRTNRILTPFQVEK